MDPQKLNSKRYNFVKFIKKIPLSKNHVTLQDEFNCCTTKKGANSCNHVVVGKVNNIELVADNITTLYLTEVLPDGIFGSAFVLRIQDEQQHVISLVKESDFFGFSNADVKQVSSSSSSSSSSLFGFGDLEVHVDSVNKDPIPEIWQGNSHEDKNNSSRCLTVQEIPLYKQKGRKVSLFGVLRSFSKEEHPLSQLKGQLILHICDEHGDFSLVLHYDVSQPLPTLEIYNIIMVKNMQILQNGENCFGYLTQPEDLFVFEKVDQHPEVACSGAANYKPSGAETLRVRVLRKWMGIQDWYPWRDENFGTTWLLKDIYKPGRYKLMCRVMDVRQMKDNSEIVLTVADGTSCPAFVKRCSDPLNVCLDDLLSDRNDFYAYESEIDIFTTHLNEKMMSLKKGNLITIGDITVINAFEESPKIEDSQSAIEYFLVFTLNKDGYTCCKVHSGKEKKSLKRKLNETLHNSSKKPKTVSVVELEPTVDDGAENGDSVSTHCNDKNMVQINNDQSPLSVDRIENNDDQSPLSVDRIDNNDDQSPLSVDRIENNDDQSPLSVDRIDNNDDQSPLSVDRIENNNDQSPLSVDRIENNDNDNQPPLSVDRIENNQPPLSVDRKSKENPVYKSNAENSNSVSTHCNDRNMIENDDDQPPLPVNRKSKENLVDESNESSSITNFSGASVQHENLVTSVSNIHVSTDESLMIQTASDIPSMTPELPTNDASSVGPSFSFVQSNIIKKREKCPSPSGKLEKNKKLYKPLAQNITEDELPNTASNRHENIHNALRININNICDQGTNVRRTLFNSSACLTNSKSYSGSNHRTKRQTQHCSSSDYKNRISHTDDSPEASGLENREISSECRHCKEVESEEDIENHMKGIFLKMNLWILRVIQNNNKDIVRCFCARCRSEVNYKVDSVYCKKCYSSADETQEDPEYIFEFALVVIDEYDAPYKVVVSDLAAIQLLDCTAATYLQDKNEKDRVNCYLHDLVLTDDDKPLRMRLKGVFKHAGNNLVHLIDIIKKPH